MTKTLIIMRGLPGSGKSTKAETIASEAQAAGKTVTIRSTDDQFMVFGVYRFDPKRIGAAHHLNHRAVEQDMKDNTEVIIVDNTSIKKWESRGYRDLAQQYGYKVEECVVGNFSPKDAEVYHARNTHGVPLEVVKRMAAQFEP